MLLALKRHILFKKSENFCYVNGELPEMTNISMRKKSTAQPHMNSSYPVVFELRWRCRWRDLKRKKSITWDYRGRDKSCSDEDVF